MNSSIQSTIEITENGIVSKKLISGEGGNVSLFSFDKGQSLDKHSTPRKALILALEGEAEFMINREKLILKKDDFVILKENEEHSLLAKTSFKMLLIILKT